VYSGSLTSFFSESIQASSTSGYYYVNVSQLNPVLSDVDEVQFAIAYGHVNGSGFYESC